ncbi:hypothetical protein M413DRAFT_21564 [Hebeloma cylindrosporum]|uniref:Uncharacterized protein n=1 Tax=Hebeloma cylindrosporum TaxID=76867 RepID=A0A0C2Z844_HEBCY|nr:hypothetical protein M413DRAFT_21564 [Hebeloma cylindrosporum h7]
MDDCNGPSSPPKAKASENGTKNWRAGWWDFYPLLEQPKRPVQWAKSSVIFTAHPTQSIVTGRHFSSSKQFFLPSPTQLIASATPYDPPSTITVGPDDLWLFAYFPRHDGEGIGCLWKRGPQIDNWGVKECWTYPKGGGVVAASWLDSNREWVGNAAGFLKRLPPRGPPIPVSEPTLLCVTQDNCVHLTYIRHFFPGLKTIKRSLGFTGITLENTIPVDFGENSSFTRRCVHAAIGIGYNEGSIVIATHSRRMPPPPPPPTGSIPQFNSMDLSVGVDLTNIAASDQKMVEWENWEEEHSIELFELQLRFDGFIMALICNSIPAIDWPSRPLSHLQFIPALPPPNVPLQPESMQSSPNTRNTPPERGMMFLISSSIDFQDYSKPPSSILTLYAVAPRVVSNVPSSRNIAWAVKKFATRTIENGVITHLEPFIDLEGPNSLLLYACILDNSGSLPTGKPVVKDVRFGKIQVLTLPKLNDDVNWEPTTIKAASENLGRDLPLFSSISPNRKFICSLSSCLSRSQITIYPLPKLRKPDLSSE